MEKETDGVAVEVGNGLVLAAEGVLLRLDARVGVFCRTRDRLNEREMMRMRLSTMISAFLRSILPRSAI